MDIPSKDARLAIWKVTLARSSFIQAKRACEALLQLGASAPEVVVTALSTTALVFYARPFKQDSEVKLDKALVPAEFTDLHEDIIRYRDKVIAHRDVKGPETPWGTANDVVFLLGRFVDGNTNDESHPRFWRGAAPVNSRRSALRGDG